MKSILCFGLVLVLLMSSASAFTNDGAGNCECDGCADCTAAVNDINCDSVTLTQDIVSAGRCVSMTSDDKAFDCGGHNITGSSAEIAVFATNISNISVSNCNVADFSNAIYAMNVTNSTFLDSELTSNGVGLTIMYSDYCTAIDITAHANRVGIAVLGDLNLFDSVAAYDNTKYGFVFYGHPTETNFWNILRDSQITDNERGLILSASWTFHTLVSNSLLCGNNVFDIEDQLGININNTGQDNRCDLARDWDEGGPDSCTFPCPSCGDGVCDATWGGEDTVTCPDDCGSICGDGACNGAESSVDCPDDCGSICGDGVCNGAEDTTNCVDDCGTACGDGVCNGDEDCDNCEDDCGKCKEKKTYTGGTTTLIVPSANIPAPPAPDVPEPTPEPPTVDTTSDEQPAAPPAPEPTPEPVAEPAAPPAPMAVSGDFSDLMTILGLFAFAGILFLFVVDRRKKSKKNSLGSW